MAFNRRGFLFVAQVTNNGDMFAYSVAEDRQTSMATRSLQTPTAVAIGEQRQKRVSSRKKRRHSPLPETYTANHGHENQLAGVCRLYPPDRCA